MVRIPFISTREAAPAQDKLDKSLEQIQRYGELLLKNPDGTPRVAIKDKLLPDRESGKVTVERTSFYAENDSYVVATTLNNSDRVVDRMTVYQDNESKDWLIWHENMAFHRFSPEPTSDIRPFRDLLENCFGELES